MQLTTGQEGVSKREAWRRISGQMGCSYKTARIWSDPQYRQQVLEAQRRYEGRVYRSSDTIKTRKREYTRLRRSQLAHEVLPGAYQGAGKDRVTLCELAELIQSQTSIRFQEDTLRKLLVDRYAGTPRGPPIEEIQTEPGYYRLRPSWYDN